MRAEKGGRIERLQIAHLPGILTAPLIGPKRRRAALSIGRGVCRPSGANVAQSVEQRFRKARVVSSILTVGSTLKPS